MKILINFITLIIIGINAELHSEDIDENIITPPLVKGHGTPIKNIDDFSNLSSAEALDLLHKLAMNSTTPKPIIIPDTSDESENPVVETVEQKPSGILNPNDSGKVRCQNSDTYLFIETAMACRDENAAVCERLFDAPDEKTGRRDPRCDQPEFETIARTCRKRCATCCEDLNYSCENDDSGLIDCQNNLNRCENPKFFDTMTKYCAGSCGLCQKTSCRDTHPDCRTMKAVCMNPKHQDTMKIQCARTCGFCVVGTSNPDLSAPGPAPAPAPASGGPTSSAGNCVDVAKNCLTRASLCNHPVYSDYMSKYCAKTCNKCKLPAGACVDTNSRCPAWVSKGFCTNNYYTKAYKKQHCAKSCGLC